MLFNRARSLDFQPELYLGDNLIEVVEETKLLGVIMSSDLKWKRHINYMKKDCYSRMWALRRMKEVGATISDMLEVYTLQIRCQTELGCPAWNGSLTKDDIAQIERIQKTALRIILGTQYVSYENALKITKLTKLDMRREKVCLKFARRMEKSGKFSKWLQRAPHQTRTAKKYILPKSRTKAIYTFM